MVEPISNTAQQCKADIRKAWTDIHQAYKEPSAQETRLYSMQIAKAERPNHTPKGIIVIPVGLFKGGHGPALLDVLPTLLDLPEDIWIVLVLNWSADYPPSQQELETIHTRCEHSKHIFPVELSLSQDEHTIGRVRTYGHRMALWLTEHTHRNVPHLDMDVDVLLHHIPDLYMYLCDIFAKVRSSLMFHLVRFMHPEYSETELPLLRFSNRLLHMFAYFGIVQFIEKGLNTPEGQEALFGPAAVQAIYGIHAFPSPIFTRIGGFGSLPRDEHFYWARAASIVSSSSLPLQWSRTVIPVRSHRAPAAVAAGVPVSGQWKYLNFHTGQQICAPAAGEWSRLTLTKVQEHVERLSQDFWLSKPQAAHFIEVGFPAWNLRLGQDIDCSLEQDVTDPHLYRIHLTLLSQKIFEIIQ